MSTHLSLIPQLEQLIGQTDSVIVVSTMYYDTNSPTSEHAPGLKEGSNRTEI